MKYKATLFWSLVFCGIFAYLQWADKFLFYYEEQLQLFLFNRTYAMEVLLQLGGFSLFIGRFLQQFFLLPCAGALVTSLLLVLAGLNLQAVLKKLAPPVNLFLLSMLPSVALLALHLDYDYLIQGTVSYLLMTTVLCLYVRFDGMGWRIGWGVGGTIVLFLIGGAVASLFGGMVLIWEVLTRKKGWLFSWLPAAMVMVMGWTAVRLSIVGEYRLALLPDMYYDPLLNVDKVFLPWAALILSILAAWLLRNRKEPSKKKSIALYAIQTAMALYIIYMSHIFSLDPMTLNNMEQDHYSRHRQWNKVISTFPKTDYNLQTLNVLNMALAQENILGERLFAYDQRGSQCLVADWDVTVQHAMALSDVYFTIGDIAASQKLAFEGNMASIQGGNPRLLQRLVQTNLIFGHYPIAERYIRLLEQTLFYRNWARQMRDFLRNDKAIESDFILGNKRRGLVGNGRYAVSTRREEVMEQVAVNNPANQIAIEYLAASCLLDKNMAAYRRLVETYFGTKTWPSLSTCMQEAVIALEEDDPQYWLNHGVSMKTEQHYWKFRYDLDNRQHNINFHRLIAETYGGTFWYYLMFKK